MAKQKILITGANGQLGNEFRALSIRYPEHEFIFLTRRELSISDAANVREVLQQHSPDWVVNCAAYTAVDKAETEKDRIHVRDR